MFYGEKAEKIQLIAIKEKALLAFKNTFLFMSISLTLSRSIPSFFERLSFRVCKTKYCGQ